MKRIRLSIIITAIVAALFMALIAVLWVNHNSNLPVMEGTVAGVNHDHSTIYVVLDGDNNGEVVFPVDDPSRFEVGDVVEIRGSGSLVMSAPRARFLPDGPLNIKIID